jgi:hypothetical protein
VAFVEYNSWIREDPSEIFTFQTPAAIKTAPHARLMNEMFGSYFFLLEPSRQTFYDMLAKVYTITMNMRMPVKLNSFAHLRVLLVLHDRGILAHTTRVSVTVR